MKLHIRHETHYQYEVAPEHLLQNLRLTPETNAHQTVLDWAVEAPGKLLAMRDGNGNVMHQYNLTHDRRFTQFVVLAIGQVQTQAQAWLTDGKYALPPSFYLQATPLTEPNAAIASFARSVIPGGANAESVVALAQAVCSHVRYMTGSTDVATSAQEAFTQGMGVCQDQAQVFLAACRCLGLPARYVSGYFYAPGASELASHACADVCLDVQAGLWFGLDITHGCPLDERHVRLAVGADYAACPPVRGMQRGGAGEQLRVVLEINQEG